MLQSMGLQRVGHNRVTELNCIMQLKFAKRIELVFSPRKKKKERKTERIYEIMNVLIKLMVEIVSQCTLLSNDNIIHFKYIIIC